MKKFLALMLALVLVLAMFAGCKPQGEPAPDAPEDDTSVGSDATDAPEADENVQLGDKTVATPGAFDVVEVVPNKAYKIVVTQMNTNDSNAVTAMDGFVQAGKYYGVEIVVMDNKGDPIQAVNNLENAITMEADYFVSYTADQGACQRIAARLTEAGMPGMGVQATLSDAYPFFRLDPTMSGEASGTPLAEAAKERFGDDVEFLVVLGYPEAGPVIADRSAAAIKAIQAIYPDIEVIEYSSKADPETSRSGMQDILTAHPEGNFLFWGHHDQYTLAAYQAIKAAGREDQCLVSSIVATEAMCDELQREGTSVIGTVSIRPEVWGWIVLPYVIEYLNNGTEIPHDLYQPCQLITVDNLAEIYPERVK